MLEFWVLNTITSHAEQIILENNGKTVIFSNFGSDHARVCFFDAMTSCAVQTTLKSYFNPNGGIFCQNVGKTAIYITLALIMT